MATTHGPDLGDEFGLLPDNAAEAGVPAAPLPPVERTTVATPDGRVSAIRWGEGSPRVVFLHGGGQNAHTWDTVVLGLGLPALCVDLPGHGHSDWRDDSDYSPVVNAGTVAAALDGWGVTGVPVVGMSLGGLTAIALAARHPGVVSGLVVVDVTPSVQARSAHMTDAQRGTTALIGGPTTFDDVETFIAPAAAAAPHRPRTSIRRGVLHNAKRLPDGRWTWRYDRSRGNGVPTFEHLWADVSALSVPVTLVRGADSVFVSDEDATRFTDRCPDASVEVVDGAGHSIQSDRPRELASLLRRLLVRR
jgi:pimeloyl-ACP methyl ester carboxylesterase